MFDEIRLQEALASYREIFVETQWEDEKFKWEAAKCFQDAWNVNAENFPEMLRHSLEGTYNLLASGNNFPAKMIITFATAAPEKVRAMFIALFDEGKDVVERILAFKQAALQLHQEYGNGAGQHYQHENAISTYLWLRYPDKYYIYKYSENKNVAEMLGSKLQFKKGAYTDNLRNFYKLYDAMCEYIQKDTQLVQLLQSQITDTCYPDVACKTLTIDVGFYISRTFGKTTQEEILQSEVPADDIDIPLVAPQPAAEGLSSYTKADFLQQVYMSEQGYDSLVAVLENKKNIILQGAPGVGKTYAAKRLAYSMMGEGNDDYVQLIQFHQNYSYEDFVMGYKPDGDGFALKYGIFYGFCQKAAHQPQRKFFFIIDEINRGNMSKIFGELLMLIEQDYRGTVATLAYDGLDFAVPKNLYIIGMMNTADRSLAMIDYALRRRFSFFNMVPGFESAGFSLYQRTLNNETFNGLIERVRELNNFIAQDKSLGKGFCIGHSYFCNRQPETCTDQWMQSVVEYDILPMLGEYWFDEYGKLQQWENNLRGVFQ